MGVSSAKLFPERTETRDRTSGESKLHRMAERALDNHISARCARRGTTANEEGQSREDEGGERDAAGCCTD